VNTLLPLQKDTHYSLLPEVRRSQQVWFLSTTFVSKLSQYIGTTKMCFLRFVEVNRCGFLAPHLYPNCLNTSEPRKCEYSAAFAKRYSLFFVTKTDLCFRLQQRVKPCTNLFCNQNWYCTSLLCCLCKLFWVVGCWHGYLSAAMCRFAYGLADATATHCLLLQ